MYILIVSSVVFMLRLLLGVCVGIVSWCLFALLRCLTVSMMCSCVVVQLCEIFGVRCVSGYMHAALREELVVLLVGVCICDGAVVAVPTCCCVSRL